MARATRLRTRLGTVRVRTTIVAVLVVAIALAGGGIALVVATRHLLTNDARDAAELRATELAVALESGTTPASLTAVRDDDVLVRVIGADGTVLSETPGFHEAGEPVVSGGTARTVRIDGHGYVTAAARADTDAGPRTLVVARTLESVTESTEVVAQLLIIGLPLLLLVVAVTTWLLAGRSLAPVEAMRREVDAISASELDRRVPQPGGGDEIDRLARTMNQMLTRLERAQQRQRQFVSDASHELRSPIASIREQSEVALAHPDRVPTAELAEHVHAEGLRIQALVENLLLLARLDEQTLELSRRAVDLDDLVFDEARRLRVNNRLRIDTNAVSAVRVAGDANGLRRAVANVAENAARHARSLVRFSLVERDGNALLTVDDDGSGIPPGERERVFERFVRLDDARARDGGGTGLGLAITAELVEAHGGAVVISESPAGGARVEIRLPSANGTGES